MNLLLIEDEQKTADALKTGLEESGYHVDLAYEGLTGLSLLQKGQYHLIISDVIMPGINGLELCQKIRTENKEIPILLLTALDSKDKVVEGFDAGADDYLAKPFDFRELLSRVKSLTRRYHTTEKHEPILRFCDIVLNSKTKQVTREDKPIALTHKEFMLLEYFLKHPNTTISRQELAQNIWHIDFNTGTNIVEVYINYLRNKIDKPFAKKVIHNIHGMGYVLKE